MTADTHTAGSRISAGVALLILLATVPFMAGLLGMYKLLGLRAPFFGVLFLLYWASMLRQDFKAYLPSVLGGLTGILVGWLLIVMPVLHGRAGTVIAYSVLAALLFCFARGQALLIVNNATLLFLIGAASPEFRVDTHLPDMVACLLVAAAYMGATAWVLQRVGRHRASKLQRGVAQS